MTGEKGYCLSPVELLILFGVSGITESLCMELPEQKDIGRENMIKGLFHLVQNGLIEIAENQEIKIHNSIGKLLDTVREAEKISRFTFSLATTAPKVFVTFLNETAAVLVSIFRPLSMLEPFRPFSLIWQLPYDGKRAARR